MEDDKTIIYTIEQLKQNDEAIEKLPDSPITLSGNAPGAFW